MKFDCVSLKQIVVVDKICPLDSLVGVPTKASLQKVDSFIGQLETSVERVSSLLESFNHIIRCLAEEGRHPNDQLVKDTPEGPNVNFVLVAVKLVQQNFGRHRYRGPAVCFGLLSEFEFFRQTEISDLQLNFLERLVHQV